MNFWKRLGNLVVAFLPMAASFAIQIICVVVAIIVCSFLYGIMLGMESPGITPDSETIGQGVMELYTENTIWVVAVTHVLSVIVFGLWYFFGMKKKNLAVPKSVRNIPTFAGGIVLGVGAQFALAGILELMMYVIPGVMEDYLALMEAAGFTELTVPLVIATVILAPIGEEILCRGITFRLAKKVSGNFWVANCIQALVFGILHGNIVQGTYAFVLGLLLGVLYERYQSLYVPILVHAVINFSSTFIVGAALAEVEMTIPVCCIIATLGIAAVVAGMFMMKNRVKIEEGVVNGAEQ